MKSAAKSPAKEPPISDGRRVTFRLPHSIARKVDERAARDRRSYNTQLIILVEKGLAG